MIQYPHAVIPFDLWVGIITNECLWAAIVTAFSQGALYSTIIPLMGRRSKPDLTSQVLLYPSGVRGERL